MDSELKPRAGTPKRHSRNISSSKVTPVRTHLHEGDFDPLMDEKPPALPQRPAERQSVPPSPRPEAFPAQTLKDFSFLLKAENFHPLTSHGVPPPFRDPDLSHLGATPSVSALLDEGYFRAAAVAAATALTATPPPLADEIFHLLYVRLACLALLGQLSQAAQECRSIDISAPFYLTTTTPRQNIIPWELRVLITRLQSIAINDPRKAILGYYDLARDARTDLLRASSEDDKQLWRSRLFDLGLRVANALIETGDIIAAARHLDTLDTEVVPKTERQLIRGRLGLLYLRIGNLSEARKYIVEDHADGDRITADYASVLRPLLSVAEGDYASAASQLEAANDASSEKALATTNMAVALLYAGELNKSKETLEELLEQGLRFPTLLFNLSTVFELCTEKARASKVQLAEKVAQEKDPLGYERSLVDFKL